jgi:hypothetical protein
MMTQWFFYFLAIGISGLTALLYLASAHAGRRLPAGKFWISFLTRGNSLLRLGFLGELGDHGRELEWGFSLCVLHVYGRSIDVVFIHYLSPAGPLPPRAGEPAPLRLRSPSPHNQAAMRDAMKLLASVVKSLFLRLQSSTHPKVCPHPVRFPICELRSSLLYRFTQHSHTHTRLCYPRHTPRSGTE